MPPRYPASSWHHPRSRKPRQLICLRPCSSYWRLFLDHTLRLRQFESVVLSNIDNLPSLPLIPFDAKDPVPRRCFAFLRERHAYQSGLLLNDHSISLRLRPLHQSLELLSSKIRSLTSNDRRHSQHHLGDESD